MIIYSIADALGYGITWGSISTFIASFGIAIGYQATRFAITEAMPPKPPRLSAASLHTVSVI